MKAYLKSRVALKAISLLISLFVGTGIFAILFGGINFLNPTEVTFLHGDSRAHYISQLFYLSDIWRFPLGLNPKYGLDLSFSSSISGPWPILLLLLQKWLKISPEMQFYGILTLVNLMLHHQIAKNILRLYGLRFALQHVLSILFFTPFLLFRLEIHPLSVAIQWPILWAIYIFLKNRIHQRSDSREIFFLVFISYCIFLNTWFIVVCIMFFQITEIQFKTLSLKLKIRTVWLKLKPTLFGTLFASIIIDGLFLVGDNPLTDGFSRVKTTGWGLYNYNLLSIINPDTGIRDYWYFKPEVGNLEGWSYNMSSTNVSFGMTYGSYEGFAYIGLGLILLCLITFWTCRRNLLKTIRSKFTSLSLTYFVLLLIYTIAPTRLTFGEIDLKLVPSYFSNLLQPLFPFRSSGRMVVFFAYLLIIVSVVLICKSLPKNKSILILLSCVVLQAVDLTKPLISRYNYSKSLSEESVEWRQSVPKELAKMAKDKRELRIFPVENFTNGYDQLAWWAWNLGMSTEAVYSARPNASLQKELSKVYRRELCFNEISKFTVFAVQKSELGIGKLKKCNLDVYSKVDYYDWLFIAKP